MWLAVWWLSKLKLLLYCLTENTWKLDFLCKGRIAWPWGTVDQSSAFPTGQRDYWDKGNFYSKQDLMWFPGFFCLPQCPYRDSDVGCQVMMQSKMSVPQLRGEMDPRRCWMHGRNWICCLDTSRACGTVVGCNRSYRWVIKHENNLIYSRSQACLLEKL